MMDRGIVSRAGDDAIQCVDLADEVALAQSADRWVAAHRTDLLRVKRNQGYSQTHPRTHRSRLDTRVSATNHNDIEPRHVRALVDGIAPVKNDSST